MALETRPYEKTGEEVTVIGVGAARLYRECRPPPFVITTAAEACSGHRR